MIPTSKQTVSAGKEVREIKSSNITRVLTLKQIRNKTELVPIPRHHVIYTQTISCNEPLPCTMMLNLRGTAQFQKRHCPEQTYVFREIENSKPCHTTHPERLQTRSYTKRIRCMQL
uniref:AlNc14C53G4085 protein n=1 Tax=Albugo laibachii Nc14 TaxID=890382 RepID=F0WBP3_9STRA|nr:AlNc14C53G4085 [Albugo laibachii Nc14]CCA20528.1 AlNc14C97G5888 [Albugo laibachii Nc14]|eukprot:CCA20528.1 AlNc14C97G5888 [Albugo laibachii Nc14]